MAQNPVGTITDGDRLIPLLRRDGTFLAGVTDPVRTAEVPESGQFAWRLRDDGEVARLAFAPVDGPDDAGDLPTAELATADGEYTLAVPETLLADGLGLDTAGYDPDNPLLFKPEELTEGIGVGTTATGDPGGSVDVAIELVPVRFDDGTPFRDEPVPESSMDSDPVAEETLAHERTGEGTPQSGTVSAPLDAAAVDEAVEATDASRDEVVEAVETVARRNLVGEADDDSTDEPLTADDRAIVALEEDTWNRRVARQVDASGAAIEAVRVAHAAQTERLLGRETAEAGRYDGRIPVVVV